MLHGYFYCINIFIYKKEVLSDGKLNNKSEWKFKFEVVWELGTGRG
jgi:hypothetical protein